jgi:hypothetical protein
VTTDQYDATKDGVGSQIGRSRLWAITFDDVTDPTKGGKIELLLDGTEAHQMFDNITVDADGNTTCRRMSATPHVTARFGSTTRIPARLRNYFSTIRPGLAT